MIETVNQISIEALKAGDREAFARFVDETSVHIYRVALKILGNEQDAEDVLQETYLKAFRSLRDFEGRSSLTTWIYRIAVNEALMIIRRQKVPAVSLDDGGSDDQEPDSEGMMITDWCCLPESDLLSAEAQAMMDRAVQRLPTNLMIVFVMRDMEGLSIQETAEALEVSEGVVKTRLLRARLSLRQELSVYYGVKLVSERTGEEIKR
jgi:RNA polymerase sigma-70 factor, ECF subfamily